MPSSLRAKTRAKVREGRFWISLGPVKTVCSSTGCETSPSPGYKTCEQCLEAAIRRRRRYKRLGKCSRCGKRNTSKKLYSQCASCRRDLKIRNREYTESGCRAYRNMMERCNKKENPDYTRYGGRGIELRLSLVEFQKIYFRPKKCRMCRCVLDDSDRGRNRKGRTIDRIDSDGHYERSNVRVVCRSCNSGRRPKAKGD